jgi:parvulin-like peptidyl-prolyl isomerase
MNRKIWTILMIMIGVNIVVLAYVLTKNHVAASSENDEAVATIGNDTISREEWLNQMEEHYGKDTLEEMINNRVIEQLAEKYRINVTDKEVEKEFLTIKAVYNSFYDNDEMTEADWKDQIRHNIQMEELLTKDVVIPEDELKDFYQKNKDLYEYQDSYHLAHIVVKTKKEAEQVVDDLDGGSSFQAVAAERSIDRYTSKYGGDLGFITSKQETIPQEYIEKAEKLTPNEFDPRHVKVDEGYAIIQLKEKLDARTFSYNEVKNQIKRQIAMEQLGDQANVKTLWKEAKVDWFFDGKE